MRYFFAIFFLVVVGLSGTAFAQSAEDKDEEHKSGILVASTNSVIYDVPYSITSGTVNEITPICDTAYAIVLFTSDKPGKLTLDIPRNLLDSNQGERDGDFFVLLDGEEIEFEETRKTHSREITVSFEPGSYDLEIITTWAMSVEIEGFACKAVHDPPYSYILPPLKQFESGSPYYETICKPGLQLTQKHDKSPACVKPETIFDLIKRDWTSNMIKTVQPRDNPSNRDDATSSYMNRVIPTLDDFKNTLSEPFDIGAIFSKFGDPHDDIGSGIHIYVYELNDFTEIWIEYVDDIRYVKHVDAEGNELEDLFVKKTESKAVLGDGFDIAEVKLFLEKYPQAEIIVDQVEYGIHKKHYMYADQITKDSVNLVLMKNIATGDMNNILNCPSNQHHSKYYEVRGSENIIEYLQNYDCLSDSDIGEFEPIRIRESFLELDFGDELITVFITDRTNLSSVSMELSITSQAWTTIPIQSLVEAHDRLPETSSDDRRGPGTIVSETEKAGTYITQNNDKEFWYTIGRSQDQIITIELQNHEFDRIVFVSENSEGWIEKINEIVDSRK